MKTIAIDFETANEERGSACAIGLSWIENGKVTRIEERLIRPKEMRFSGFNISIHGITPEEVIDKPEFPAVIAEFLPDLNGALVLAHNAAFDLSVIRATLDKYERPYPEFSYLCTAKIARQVWPDLLTTSLSEVADHIGIKFTHHRAGSDAYASGAIALAAANKLGVADVLEIPTKIRIVPGKLQAKSYKPCSTEQLKDGRPSKVLPTEFDWNKQHPLYQKFIVFTGGLNLMTRFEATQRVVNLGGHVQDGVVKTTDFLVVAGEDYHNAIRAGKMSNKLKKAVALAHSDHPIEIISEEQFYRLIL